MRTVLAESGRSFLHLFFAALVVYGAGILNAPDLDHTYLIAVAATIAAFAAALVAILTYLPSLSWVHVFGHPFGDWADSFTYAFISSLIVTLPGVLGAPDFHTLRAVAVGAIVGAATAGVRAIEGLLTPGDHPGPAFGLPKASARPS